MTGSRPITRRKPQPLRYRACLDFALKQALSTPRFLWGHQRYKQSPVERPKVHLYSLGTHLDVYPGNTGVPTSAQQEETCTLSIGLPRVATFIPKTCEKRYKNGHSTNIAARAVGPVSLNRRFSCISPVRYRRFVAEAAKCHRSGDSARLPILNRCPVCEETVVGPLSRVRCPGWDTHFVL